MGDSLKLLGRSVYVEDLDAKAAGAAGLDRGRVCVVAGTDGGQATVTVFAEAPDGPWRDAMLSALRGELGREPAIAVVCGQRGLIRRTSSGKPRRRHMWHLLLDGAFAQQSVTQPHDPERLPVPPDTDTLTAEQRQDNAAAML